ncbi:YwqJ-related putative deaminase [Streptomyces sp. NPDC001288]|uniref:YwqJ-related putative deaminase n=1 Tax=unclassified Streptomyces TaxID=2593676 RepID=UPI00331DCF9C
MITEFTDEQLAEVHSLMETIQAELTTDALALPGPAPQADEMCEVLVRAVERACEKYGIGAAGYIFRRDPGIELAGDTVLGYFSYPVWLLLDHFLRESPGDATMLPALAGKAWESFAATITHRPAHRRVHFAAGAVAEDDHHGGHAVSRRPHPDAIDVPMVQQMADKISQVQQHYAGIRLALAQLHANAVAEQAAQGSGGHAGGPALDAYRGAVKDTFGIPADRLGPDHIQAEVDRLLAPLRHEAELIFADIESEGGPRLRAGRRLTGVGALADQLRWVSDMLSRCLHAAYQLQASNAQRSRLPGMTGSLHVGGTVVPAVSAKGETDLHPVIGHILAQIPRDLRGTGHGKCSEMVALSAYLRQWEAENVRLLHDRGLVAGTPAYAEGVLRLVRNHLERGGAVTHATFLYKGYSFGVQACATCRAVLTKLAVHWVVPDDGLPSNEAAEAYQDPDPQGARERLLRQRQRRDDEMDYWVGPGPHDVADRPVQSPGRSVPFPGGDSSGSWPSADRS